MIAHGGPTLTLRFALSYYPLALFPALQGPISLGLGINCLTSTRVIVQHLLTLASIRLLAFIVRFAIVKHYQDRLAPGALFEFGDSETYWRLGNSMARGEPYAYSPRPYRNVFPNFSGMQSTAMRLVVLLGYAPVMIFAALGAWKLRSRGDVLLVCLRPVIYFSLLHMVYIGAIRYRQPAMFPIFVLAAVWIARWCSTMPPSDRKEAIA